MTEPVELTSEMIAVLVILGLTIYLFAFEVLRVDVAATSIVVLVGLTVLADDTDLDTGDVLTVSSVTQPANGSVVNNNTDLAYTPNAGYSGTDTFTYIATDGTGVSNNATVTVTVTAPPSGSFDPIAAHNQLVTEATGYFKHAGGTGGQGGDIYYVTNLNNSGSGSLRVALEQSGPAIILFEDGVNGTINLSSKVEVKSNKTLWGRHRDGSAADIFIHPTSSGAAFKITDGNKNIILANLKGDALGPNDSAPDFVSVSNGGSIVWVHHVTVIGDGTDDMDGFVDVTTGGRDVTISWCRVEDWSAVHLLRYGAIVTLHHNLWRNSRDRLPKVDGVNQTTGEPGKAHAFNNWADSWKSSAMKTTNGGEVVAENTSLTPLAIKMRLSQEASGTALETYLPMALLPPRKPQSSLHRTPIPSIWLAPRLTRRHCVIASKLRQGGSRTSGSDGREG